MFDAVINVQVLEVTHDFVFADLEMYVSKVNNNPGFIAIREVLEMEPKKFDDEILFVMKELYPHREVEIMMT